MSDKGNRISQVVENRQHIIKHCRGKMFTSESLKIVALICMLIDHAGATLFPQCDILRSIGRVSFPLYAFLLAQGCKHTHSMERYLLGLGIFALISEIPYDLAFGNSINFLDQTNIFYTLLSSFIDCDYGIWGVALISLLYLAKSIKISAVIMAVLLVPYYGQHIYSNVVSFEAIRNMCFSLLSILFVCLYNGQHGSKKKWIYYWAYPLHILFFAILRCYPFF